MNLKTRLLTFLDKKGISKRQFYAETGLSNGTLDKVENIGSDKVEKIYDAYPEINLVWLITGKGKMIRDVEDEIDKVQGKGDLLIPIIQSSDKEPNKIEPNQNKTLDTIEKRLENLELDMKLLKQSFLKLEK